MSSNDDKADLSNLKSRLGLNKDEKKEKEQEDQQTESSGPSGGDQDVADRTGEPEAGATASRSTGDSGGVEDRLAALKGSTQKSGADDQSDPAGARGRAEAQSGASQEPSSTPGQSRQPGGAGQGGQGGQPAGGGHGPPPGAQGPPPTAQGPPPTSRGGQSSTGTTGSSTDESAEVDIDDVDPDDINLSDIGVEDDSIFSVPVIGLLIVLLAAGVIFGFLMAETTQTRELEQTRIDDAAELQSELDPRLDEFDEAREIIEDLDPTDVDFQAAEDLEELEFTVNAGVLPGNRILLGEEIIRPLNRYMGESNVLAQLIAEHHRLTTQSDREELEAFMEDLDEIGEDEQLAAVFDVMRLRAHMAEAAQGDAEPADYIPAAARLVRIPDDFEELEPDDEGMVEVEVVASEAPDDVDITSLVPIVDTDFLDVDSGNAMQQYGDRVDQMQRYVEELEGSVPVLREEVEEVASADSPPLFTLTSGDDPTDEYTDEEEDDVPDPDELLEEEGEE